MQIDVGELVNNLLYEHDTVSIPGLGAIIKSNKAIEIDHIQGKINPESTGLEFNPNLAIDDGLLVAYIRDKFHISYQEAKSTIAEYVQQVKEALARKEIIVFPGVGRLYHNFEGQLQFIPDGTNFDLSNFGLPTVHLEPLPQKTPITAATASQSAAATVPIIEEEDNALIWLKKNWPLLLGLLALLAILLAFWFLYPKYFRAQEPDPTAELPSERLNVKPPVVDDATADTNLQDTPNTPTDLTAANEEPSIDEEVNSQTDASTVAPANQSCVIAIGIFREKVNVDRLAKRIIEAGFEPYLEQLKTTTRVGVQFSYSNDDEINRNLERVKNLFAPDAFVLKK